MGVKAARRMVFLSEMTLLKAITLLLPTLVTPEKEPQFSSSVSKQIKCYRVFATLMEHLMDQFGTIDSFLILRFVEIHCRVAPCKTS